LLAAPRSVQKPPSPPDVDRRIPAHPRYPARQHRWSCLHHAAIRRAARKISARAHRGARQLLQCRGPRGQPGHRRRARLHEAQASLRARTPRAERRL